ncbi:excision endonuclease subunit UvrD domain protein [Mycobacterium kansasii 662]|uniref:Excision endonuclease subunit UvrD domain protein n=1 Tax=Mycobacterium kansasii 662 TaxID=1299326 RepID=X7XNZ0_MYCKA|nr:excision endonuclease subunit UvrD domain protein [Mycobacterium kansasii 662]
MSESPGPEWAFGPSAWALARAPAVARAVKPSRFLNGIAPQTRAEPGAAKPVATGPLARCRVCNKELITPAAVMRGDVKRVPATFCSLAMFSRHDFSCSSNSSSDVAGTRFTSPAA